MITDTLLHTRPYDTDLLTRIDESHADVVRDNPERATEMADEVLTLLGMTEFVKAWREVRGK